MHVKKGSLSSRKHVLKETRYQFAIAIALTNYMPLPVSVCHLASIWPPSHYAGILPDIFRKKVMHAAIKNHANDARSLSLKKQLQSLNKKNKAINKCKQKFLTFNVFFAGLFTPKGSIEVCYKYLRRTFIWLNISSIFTYGKYSIIPGIRHVSILDFCVNHIQVSKLSEELTRFLGFETDEVFLRRFVSTGSWCWKAKDRMADDSTLHCFHVNETGDL